MQKTGKKHQENTPKEKSSDRILKNKSYAKKPTTTLSKQTSRIMKEKYIRDMKDRPKDTETGTEQATEEVEQGERWAAGELTSTAGRIVRQGRNYAQKKAEAARAAKREAEPSPADVPPEAQPPASPEAVSLEGRGYESVLDAAHPKTASAEAFPHVRPPAEAAVPGADHPASAPKERRQTERRTAEPLKERRIAETKPPPSQEGKRPQPRRTVKPLKERPINYGIKERPPMEAPKSPGRPTPQAAASPLATPDKTRSERPETPNYSMSQPDSRRTKPKMAVPMEKRRELAEKKRASPYAPRDTAHPAPMDILPPSERSALMPPTAPVEPFKAVSPQSRHETQGKNPAAERSWKAAREGIKERQHILFSRRDAGAAERPAPFPKSRRTMIKPAGKPDRRPPAPAQRAAAAAKKQAQRKMLTQPKKAVKTIGAAFKRIVGAATRAVSAMTTAVTAIIGGGILLTALVIVIVIAAVANSPFGLFYAQEPNAPDTVSVSQAVGSVKAAYNAKLEELQTGDYDSIDIQGEAPDWTEVLAVFAVKLAGAEVDGLDVATLDPERVRRLTDVFWDMTAISTEVETIDHPASGDREAWTEKILHITITPKSADDMRTVYSFTPYQNSALDELLSDRPTLNGLAGSLDITGADEREVLSALPADLEQARRDTVEKALSLVGKVNYFWGGKSRAIGWDSRWGTLQKVTAAGSPSTGTYRPFGLDCSGMIDWALRNAGLPSDGNWYVGVNLTRVSASEARPGDMALFTDASHIGIVVGRNEAGKLLVCHCSSGRNNVVVTEFSATGFTVVGRPNIYRG